MLLKFFDTLRAGEVPCTLREHLDLLRALEKGVAVADMETFYFLSRSILVKDERYFDKFDRAFDVFFKGVEDLGEIFAVAISEDWLRKQLERNFDDEEMKRIEAMGGIEKMVEEFKRLWNEQHERHEGGKKYIGTAGTSPFGNGGQNPEGMKIGGDEQSGEGSGVKTWQQRQYRNLDDDVELGTRNIKIALRRLRRFARTGLTEELDMDGTVRKTANNGGLLDIDMRPERHNAIKVMVLFDVGGSMDPYVRTCEELFSACRSEFKHLEYYYFHNFVYDHLWKDNRRRMQQAVPSLDVLHKYAADYCVIFVGDATMAPYEITSPGGSIEHWNDEPGMVWMQRFIDVYPKLIWLNPVPQEHWDYSPSLEITRRLIEDRMHPLTPRGLEEGMSYLSR